MRIYQGFVAALDATGENISRKLSEVDVSSPEDVKAILPEGEAAGGREILVHFGEEKFLERYHQFEQRLPEWKTQYPHLASVDMRYERQVVLQMQPGTAVPSGDEVAASGAGAAKETSAPVAISKAAAVKSDPPVVKHDVAAKKVAPPKNLAASGNAVNPVPVQHLTTSFAVTGRSATKPAAGAGQGAPR
jgi:cell division protein FtsQ